MKLKKKLNLKKNPKQRKIKKKRTIIKFFSQLFFIKIISFLLFSRIKNQVISKEKIMSNTL